jgi:O-acetyl-ADP-ribose deacetylase (regulator of RNase III)
MLKEISTGKELRRPVHANRIRLLRELDNDYRIGSRVADVTLFGAATPRRGIMIRVRVDDLPKSKCDVIVCPCNDQYTHGAGAARAIGQAAGESMQEECNEALVVREPGMRADIVRVLQTTAGKLNPPVRSILHVTGPNLNDPAYVGAAFGGAQVHCKECYTACLRHANRMPGVKSVAVPAISAGLFGMDPWTVAHAAAQAISDFDNDAAPKEIILIELVCIDLTTADVVKTVFRQILTTPGVTPGREVSPNRSPIPVDTEDPDRPTESAESDPNELVEPVEGVSTESSADIWYAVKRLVRHQRKKGKDLYLVEWEDYPGQTWIERACITDAALQAFYATRRRRKRRA